MYAACSGWWTRTSSPLLLIRTDRGACPGTTLTPPLGVSRPADEGGHVDHDSPAPRGMDVIRWLASHSCPQGQPGAGAIRRRRGPGRRGWRRHYCRHSSEFPGTWPACSAARVAQYAHQQPHWPPREPTPHSTLTTCCKPRRHTCGPAGRRVDERISPSTRLCQRACLTRKEPSLLSSRDGLSLLPLHAAPT